MTLSLVTPAAALAVTLDEAKSWCRVDGTGQDAVLATMLGAAIDAIEQLTARPLAQQGWVLTLDCFPANGTIEVPLAPLISVDAVKYIDTAGAQQTLSAADYVTDLLSNPGRIVLAEGVSWPSIADRPAAVTVEFTVGYSDTFPLPDALKGAVLSTVTQWFDDRAMGDLPPGALRLLSPYRRIVI